VASSAAPSFGPYPAPAGLVVEGVCFEFSGGQPGCASTNPHLVVQ
jgi:hypothetical protein